MKSPLSIQTKFVALKFDECLTVTKGTQNVYLLQLNDHRHNLSIPIYNKVISLVIFYNTTLKIQRIMIIDYKYQ